jgi:hypothetical protein
MTVARWRDRLMRWLFPPYPESHDGSATPENPDDVDFQQAIREHEREMRLIEEIVSTYRQKPSSRTAPEVK